MKRIVLTAVAVLISICAFSQKIKIDKGQVLLDGIPIAKVESPVIKEYKISNLDGTNSIMAYMRIGNPYTFIELNNEAINKSNEMNFVKYSPFNVDRSIIQTLFSKGLMTANGIDIEKVNAFLNEAPSGLAAKYGYVKEEVLDAEAQIANSYQLSVDDNGAIYSQKVMKENQALTANSIPAVQQMDNGSNGIIGYVKVTLKNGSIDKYEITDLDNYLIGSWFVYQGSVSGYDKFLNQELITFNKKVFVVKLDNSIVPTDYRMSKDATAMNVVRKLIGNGYTLQHQGSIAATEMRAEQIEKSIANRKATILNSKNIYNKNGYVINEKGEKRIGTITAEFESTKDYSNQITDIGVYGKTVVLKFIDEKGQGKTEIFKSKNGIRFCIEKEGKEECYFGLKTIGNSMAAAESIGSLSFDSTNFYKILYENTGYLVLVNPIVPSDFIIKIPNQEKGLYTNNSSIEKVKKNVTEYAKCDAFVFDNYDFKTLDGLIKVLEDYKKNCVK
ncbi:hypothetical protein FNW52_10390 [Flavobacterium sp. ZT3R18]|uniref:hypothetical protein n=1 Tax=Flavobacterium sp. ZT3R18 TaxID=2594429 RepID=UPI00117A3A0F|nr:hypothetical protein [Flavobacterium sp. ZT3R18]TRX35445.1 hypothetical protein FNW52_10390 [Flavobacterium sp. ZT3R18]